MHSPDPGLLVFPLHYVSNIKKIQTILGAQEKSFSSHPQSPWASGFSAAFQGQGWWGAGVHNLWCVTSGRLLISAHSFQKRAITVSCSKNIRTVPATGPEGWQAAHSQSQQPLVAVTGVALLGVGGPPPGVSSLTAPACPQTPCVMSSAAQ